MENDSPGLRDISKEVLTEEYFDRARQRARRRRSRWNLVLVPFAVCGVAVTGYVLFQIMWHVHTSIYPAHTGKLAEFWRRGIELRAFVSSFLLAVPLFIAALPLGMIIANLAAWCIPPARKIFETEAQGVKWASFRDSMSGLAKIALIVVPICLLLSFIGAATLKTLR